MRTLTRFLPPLGPVAYTLEKSNASAHPAVRVSACAPEKFPHQQWHFTQDGRLTTEGAGDLVRARGARVWVVRARGAFELRVACVCVCVYM